MPTLKEIKGRIASVKNTLKITSAMKLVSSAKLHKAQQAIEAMRPYEQRLQVMLATVASSSAGSVPDFGTPPAKKADFDGGVPENGTLPALIIAIASNSSLCGGFNANAIAKVRSIRKPGDTVISIGRKMADAMRRDGFPSPQDFSALSEHPAYAPCAALVEQLTAEMAAGKYARVVLVYNHFVSTARQTPVVETLLGSSEEMSLPSANNKADAPGRDISSGATEVPDVIIEPSRPALMAALIPKTRKLKLYAALLDSAAAEHAARTVAMQTATDNGEDLLAELTLQYNKGRQQKITSEILDLAGGQVQQ